MINLVSGLLSRLLATETPFESPLQRKLYYALRRHGLEPAIEYHHQGYYFDLAFPEVRIAVEVDGETHNSRAQVLLDKQRDRHNARRGWLTLRYPGVEVHRDAGRCAAEVARVVRAWQT